MILTLKAWEVEDFQLSPTITCLMSEGTHGGSSKADLNEAAVSLGKAVPDIPKS